MNGRDALSADQILERVRGAVVPTEADAARNFAGVEARLGLSNSNDPPAGGESAADSERRVGNGAAKLAPKLVRHGASAARPGLALVARIGRWASFGLATGLVGYLLGRSQSAPSAAPAPAAILAPATAVPSPLPPLETLGVAAAADSRRGDVADPSSAAAVNDPPTRSAKPLAPGESPPHARMATAPRAVLHRSDPPVVPAPPAAEADPGLPLGEALELLRRAESAVRNSDGLQAQMWLGDLDRRAPREMLREERLATSVLAACVLGDLSAARAALVELERTNSDSLYRARLETSCAASAASKP